MTVTLKYQRHYLSKATNSEEKKSVTNPLISMRMCTEYMPSERPNTGSPKK